jgi:3',5'-cyclic AMP phosphodiesterase CpdA
MTTRGERQLKQRAWALHILAALVCALACQCPARGLEKTRAHAATSAATSVDVPSAAEPLPKKQRTGVLDVTFFVASDVHLGFRVPSAKDRDIVKEPVGIEQTNLRMIASMNTAPGRKLPTGDAIGVPRGVLITGDLTERGGAEQWAMFEQMYGRSGQGGPLAFPVFEADGNHDRARNRHVREQITRRHGSPFYSMNWDDLHVICLAEAPNKAGMAFLKKDLQTIEKGVPIVIYMHYPLAGPYSENWWSKRKGQDKLRRALRGHNVVAIIHGHNHATGAYRWKNYDAYIVGSPKNANNHTYLVVRVTNDKLAVAALNYDTDSWWWWHEKPINDGTTPRRFWVKDPTPDKPQPIVDL